jgi:hypothetical protein
MRRKNRQGSVEFQTASPPGEKSITVAREWPMWRGVRVPIGTRHADGWGTRIRT